MFARTLGRLIGRATTRAAINAVETGVHHALHNRLVVGWIGEKHAERVLNKLPGEYIVLSNLLLPNGSDTAQIDHVVVSMYGIFVIETKNYHGYVEGRGNERHWLHRVGHERHQMYNPIRQNRGHIRALQALLGDDKPSIYVNLIAFGREAELSVRAGEWVGCVDDLPRVIQRYQRVRLDGRQVRNAVEVLLQENRTGLTERWRHVGRVKRQHEI